MSENCAYIVIDSGFSREVIEQSGRVMAAWDLTRNKKFESEQYISEAQIDDFAGDPMGHGSIVMDRLLRVLPEANVILVKAFGVNDVCRTIWKNGEVVQPGWTEAYLWAAEFAQAKGMVSSANCSFGGVTHAMDGTGWEAYQLSKMTGPGKSGHVLLAAAGTGDGRAVHSAMTLLAGESKSFIADQDNDCEYNFWFGLNQHMPPFSSRWTMEAWQNGKLVFGARSEEVPPNMWNGKQQVKFRNWGSGRVEIDVRRDGGYQFGAEENLGLKVDVYAEGARFRNWISPELIPEPACLPHVIAVGLQASIYSASQNDPGKKPDILLPGSGQISFRLPEMAVAVGQILEKYPGLDVDGVRAILGKYPQGR